MRPKKSLSQNFLVNDKAAARIAEALGLKKDDTVLEIGAGQGALTRHFLDRAGAVYAVEIDKRLCSELRKRFGSKRNLNIINKDILKVNLEELIGPGNSCKVVGNLPYQITSPVLSLVLQKRKFIVLCVLTVQKEVALRICASPGEKDWSPLSIAVQLYSDVDVLFHLKPTSFFPPPRVESSVIKMVLLSEPKVNVPDEEFFFRVVRSAFGQRRKTLLNSLAANLSLPKGGIEVILRKVELDPQRRAETLGLDEFAALSSAMMKILS